MFDLIGQNHIKDVLTGTMWHSLDMEVKKHACMCSSWFCSITLLAIGRPQPQISQPTWLQKPLSKLYRLQTVVNVVQN